MTPPRELLEAIAREDAETALRDLDTLDVVTVMTGHEAQVNELSYSPNGNLLASASYDGTVRIWPPREIVISASSATRAGAVSDGVTATQRTASNRACSRFIAVGVLA